MSAWPIITDTPVTTDVSVTTTTETVVATVSGINSPGPGARVKVRGWVQHTSGTATTALTLRIRRGTDATGTLIGEGDPVQGGVAAGSTSALGLETTDTPTGELANASYVLTIQQTAATGNGTTVQAFLSATV